MEMTWHLMTCSIFFFLHVWQNVDILSYIYVLKVCHFLIESIFVCYHNNVMVHSFKQVGSKYFILYDSAHVYKLQNFRDIKAYFSLRQKCKYTGGFLSEIFHGPLLQEWNSFIEFCIVHIVLYVKSGFYYWLSWPKC